MAGGLTEEDIRNGKTYQRNPYMGTFATNALYYKGIGSGIVRILAEFPEIQLENDASAKEFKVIIKRIIQKSDSTTQKSESATQKGQFEDIDTTQKREIATQKNLDTTQKKVLEYFKDNPKATRVDAANADMVIFYLKIFGDLRILLYLCVQKINEGPASDEFSLVGDGTFFMSENIELTNKILT